MILDTETGYVFFQDGKEWFEEDPVTGGLPDIRQLRLNELKRVTMSTTEEGIKRALALAGISGQEAAKVTLPGELVERIERSNRRKLPLSDYVIEII